MTGESRNPEGVGPWLSRLRGLAQGWVRDNDGLARWVHRGLGRAVRTAELLPMDAYVDLIFSFALARLGQQADSRELLGRAEGVLGGSEDEVHRFLLTAYNYRITQALEGKPHTGPLPADQVEHLEHMDMLQLYVVDRLRSHSRILEPDRKIDPYRKWGGRGDFHRALSRLPGYTDPGALAAEVRRLLASIREEGQGAKMRALILRGAFSLGPFIGRDLACELLAQTTATCDALPEEQDERAPADQAELLDGALFMAAHFGLGDWVPSLAERVARLLQVPPDQYTGWVLECLARRSFRGLCRLGLHAEASRLLAQLTGVVLRGQDLQAFSLDKLEHGPTSLRALLYATADCQAAGLKAPAEEVCRITRVLLLEREFHPTEKTALACAYVTAVGRAAGPTGREQSEEVFGRLRGVHDTYTTRGHFTVSHLDVIEATVLAVVDASAPPAPDAPITVPAGP